MTGEEDISIDSLKKTAKSKLVGAIRSVYTPEGMTDNTLRSKNRIGKVVQGSSQSEIPIKDIVDGIVSTEDGRYIGYLEVIPKNFWQESEVRRMTTTDTYASLYKNGPSIMMVAVLSDTSNPMKLIETAQRNADEYRNKDDENSKNVIIATDDYVNHIKTEGSNGSVTRRFIIVFGYEKSMSPYDQSPGACIQAMREAREHIRSILHNCGNICPVPDNETRFVSELLYYWYNRLTSKEESFDERYERITKDYTEFNERNGANKEPSFADVIAPKGIKFTNRSNVQMDGLYYGYIGLNGNHWKKVVYGGGWIDDFYDGANVDVFILSRRLPHDITTISIKTMGKADEKSLDVWSWRGNRDKYKKTAQKLGEKNIINASMSSGDEMIDCGIIISIRANTERQLGIATRRVLKKLKDSQRKGETSFPYTEDYFRMTSPFLTFAPVFSRLKHNTLASDMASTYCYTNFEMFDTSGFVMGEMLNFSLLAFNPFNRDYVANSNIAVLGKSGAGKTFTLQLLAGRMFLTGIRCFFILPQKGYEYEEGCRMHGGSFISLGPGLSACINIGDIRPEGMVDRSKLDDDTVVDKGSLLSKKINSIITWISLHFEEDKPLELKEFNHINAALNSIYNRMGITDDNTSIYKDKEKGIFKKFPTIGDFYNAFKKIPSLERVCDILLPYITGNCQNMNSPTNVELTNRYTVFDVDGDLIGEKLLAPFMYIAFDYTYSEIKSNILSMDMMFMDEVWRMMQTKECAKQVFQAVKLVRGYGGGTVVATQQILDLLGAKGDYGKAVIDNSDTKLILGMLENELDLVKEKLKLSEEECKQISTFSPGWGMMLSPKTRVTVHMVASKLEFDTYNTDVGQRLSKVS